MGMQSNEKLYAFATLLMLGALSLQLGCSSSQDKTQAAQDAGTKAGATSSKTKSARDAGNDAGEAKDAGKPQADAGAEAAPDAAPPPPIEPIAMASFRVTELYLRDPHFFIAGVDVTDQALLGTSVNGSLIPDGLTKDEDGDGLLDLSVIGAFQPLDPMSATGMLDLVNANCPIADATHCVADPAPTLSVMLTLENHASGTCLQPLTGTTSSFKPSIELPSGPCFASTNPVELMFNLGGIDIALTGARVAASYYGGAQPRLIHGLIAGFLTQANAMSAVLPASVGAPLAGTPLVDYLRSTERDKDQSPNGEDGWWIYFNFVASAVTYTP